LLLGFVVARGACVGLVAPQAALDGSDLREGQCQVLLVVDGHTLLVRQPQVLPPDRSHVAVPLRLLGIDAPTTVASGDVVTPWDSKARALLKQLVVGRTVWLQLDRRRLDDQDRYLAYVFVDDLLVNEALVRAGLARVATYPGDSTSMLRRLQRAEREARRQRRGFWSLSASGNDC
jgi:micrococcal nuclease